MLWYQNITTETLQQMKKKFFTLLPDIILIMNNKNSLTKINK